MSQGAFKAEMSRGEIKVKEILEQAGKNPRAVKLALPPSHLQPRFFFDLYEKYRDVNKAYRESLTYCGNNENYKLQCYE